MKVRLTNGCDHAVSYDISKDGQIAAVLTLVKAKYRLGDTVAGVVTMNRAGAIARVVRVSLAHTPTPLAPRTRILTTTSTHTDSSDARNARSGAAVARYAAAGAHPARHALRARRVSREHPGCGASELQSTHPQRRHAGLCHERR